MSRFRMKTLILVMLYLIILLLTGCSDQDGSGQSASSILAISETLRTSLHGTTRGMAYWYATDQGGFQQIADVPYKDLGCKSCHVPASACYTCHLDPLAAPKDAQCLTCHRRQQLEQDLGLKDVHRSAGMACVDCHTISQVHGNRTFHQTMFNGVISMVDCTDCHALDKLPSTPAHTSHGNRLHCTACHMRATVSCYNCHFESEIAGKGKVPYGAFSDWLFLVKWRGQVHQGNLQTITYNGKSFITIAPFAGHSVYVPPAGYEICHKCHENEMVMKYQQTGTMTATWWDETDREVENFAGVIPVPEDWQEALKLTYVTMDESGEWVLVNNDADVKQMLFCEPLDMLPPQKQ